MVLIDQRFEETKREKGLLCDYSPPRLKNAKNAIGTFSLNGHRVAIYQYKKGTPSFRYTPPQGIKGGKERARTGAHTLEEIFLFADRYLRNKDWEYEQKGIEPDDPKAHTEKTILRLEEENRQLRDQVERLEEDVRVLRHQNYVLAEQVAEIEEGSSE